MTSTMDRQTMLVSCFLLSRRSGFKVHMACINNWAVQENAAHRLLIKDEASIGGEIQ